MQSGLPISVNAIEHGQDDHDRLVSETGCASTVHAPSMLIVVVAVVVDSMNKTYFRYLDCVPYDTLR